MAALQCGCRRLAPESTELARYPEIPLGRGAVLHETEVVSVTFSERDAESHDAFIRSLVETGWLLARTREYGVRNLEFGGSLRLGPSEREMDDEHLRSILRTAGVREGSVYVVWMPEGTSLIDREGNRTCFSNPGTGYHDAIDTTGPAYVAVPACPPRFSAVLDRTGSMHLDAARLLVNTLTNPLPHAAPAFSLSDGALGWTGLGTEVGDLCWGRFVDQESVKLQRVWSNSAIKRGEEPCSPTIAAGAFGLTVEPRGRLLIEVGRPVRLAVRGFSTKPRPDWRIEARPWAGDFAIETSLDKSVLNAGESTVLTISVPHPVPKGTEGTVLLRSLADDDTPLWPISFVTN